MKSRLLLFILGFVALSTHAQQDAQFTQYMYNTINVNPAYAGSRGMMNIFGLHRTQWVGIEGAPQTNSFSLNTPLNGSQVGLGVSVLNDKIGPTVENTLTADFSYTIQTSDTYKLAFGLKAGGSFFNLDVSLLDPNNPIDPSLTNYNKFNPQIGGGLYLHSEKTYIGVSVPNFLQTNRYNDNDVLIYTPKMTYYVIAGHVFDLSPTIQFKPALLTKIVNGAPLQVDVSGNVLLNEKLTLGLAYRWDAAVSGLAGFQVSEGLFIGYGYDYETTKLQKYNSGSHELFLRFELFSNYNTIVSPRFF
jgi:type IX secretion system PorP/SprF family membrane protein